MEISSEQFGFMPNRTTTDAIFALRQIMEKYREGQKALYIVFIDLEKAYDSLKAGSLEMSQRKDGTRKIH